MLSKIINNEVLHPNQLLQIQSLLKQSIFSNKDTNEIDPQVIAYLLVKSKPLQAEQRRFLKKYLQQINEDLKLEVDIGQFISKRRKQLKLVYLSDKKIYELEDKKLKTICLFGKIINLKKIPSKEFIAKQIMQSQQQKLKLSEILTNVQRIYMIQCFKQRFKLPKYPKNIQISQYLLNFQIPQNYQIISFSTKAFNFVYPVIPSVLLTFPIQYEKPQINNLLKIPQFNYYIDQALPLNQKVRKIHFYRGYILQGIIFVGDGEVQVPSGRIVARGWIVTGNVKATGYGWKFDPITFFKVFMQKQNLWRQYVYDITLNGQIPLKYEKLLEMQIFKVQQKEKAFPELTRNGSGYNYNIGDKQKKQVKLPTIRHLNSSLVQQLNKVKHYDGRINGIEQYKKAVLKFKTRADQGNKNEQQLSFVPFFDYSNQKKSGRYSISKSYKKSKSRYNSNSNKNSKNIIPSIYNSGNKQQLLSVDEGQQKMVKNNSSNNNGNVLVNSVLHKLQSLADEYPSRSKAGGKQEFMNVKLMMKEQEQSLNLGLKNNGSNRYKRFMNN